MTMVRTSAGSRSWVKMSIGIASFLLLLAALASPVRAETGGSVTVTLVLRGAVVTTDNFAMFGGTASGAVGIEPVYCGQHPNAPDDSPVCAERAYEVEIDLDWQVGDTFSFNIVRCTGQGGDTCSVVYEGAATITAAPQTFTVVYDYSLGSPATPGITLPDTATPVAHADPIAPLGHVVPVAVLAVVLAIARLTLIGHTPRSRPTNRFAPG